MAVAFYTLDTVFGREALTKHFIPAIVRRFAWNPKCIPTSQLSPLFQEAVGSSEAKRVFDTFFMSPHPPDQPPLVHLHLHPNRTLSASQPPSQQLSIPFEVVDEARRVLRLTLHETQQHVHKPANYIVAVPNSYVRHIYNVTCFISISFLYDLSLRPIVKVENYEKLAECFVADGSGGKCPTTDEYALRSAMGDLCWALLDNRLGSNGTLSLGSRDQWHSLFRTLSAKKELLSGDCSCCMQEREVATATAQCRWTWRDKCSRISIVN